MKNVEQFSQELGIPFHDTGLLETALVHPSFCQERDQVEHNQRLEFLGDAVLDFLVAEYLYNNFPDFAEGELTRIRASLVCERGLYDLARRIGLGKYLILGRGEEKSGGRQRRSILADAVEALLGAIYLDQGLGAARDFVTRHFAEEIEEVAQTDCQDFKSRLQETVQARYRDNVNYRVIQEEGPPHERRFEIGVFFHEQMLGSGSGRSKKEAEQKAAQQAIELLDEMRLNP